MKPKGADIEYRRVSEDKVRVPAGVHPRMRVNVKDVAFSTRNYPVADVPEEVIQLGRIQFHHVRDDEPWLPLPAHDFFFVAQTAEVEVCPSETWYTVCLCLRGVVPSSDDREVP